MINTLEIEADNLPEIGKAKITIKTEMNIDEMAYVIRKYPEMIKELIKLTKKGK